MRKIYLTIFILIYLNFLGFSQNYEKVDSIVKKYPKEFYNTNELATYIRNDFKRQDEKARAIFTWIALNIKYDLQILLTPPDINDYFKRTEEEKKVLKKLVKDGAAAYLLRKGKGICSEYSILFKEICNLVSLDCEIVDGAGKNGILHIDSLKNNTNHSWNAVKIDNQWKLVDVTWASGYYDEISGKIIQEFNDFFFCTPPEIFAQSHFPVDSKWLLTKKSKKSFDESPIFFTAYYQKNFNIEKPKKGRISIGRKIIEFVLTDCSNECLYFKFGNENESRFVCPEIIKGKCVYEIDYEYANSTYLTIFWNKDRIAKYLVKK